MSYNPVNKREFRKWLEQCAIEDEKVGMGGTTSSCPIAIYANRKLGTDNQVLSGRRLTGHRRVAYRNEWYAYGKVRQSTLPKWALDFMRYVDLNYPLRDMLASEAIRVLDKVVS